MTAPTRTIGLVLLLLTFARYPEVGAAAGDGFDQACSWSTFDPGDHDISSDPDGYWGAVFDGRYVYFAPHRNQGSHFHAQALRYDTLGDFGDIASWSMFNPNMHGVGTQPVGYAGCVFDGRYVYYVPWRNNMSSFSYHGEFLRCDTWGEYTDVSSWAAFDPGADGLGNDPDGYRGGVFDGRYVYFRPYHNGTAYHGEVLRYDATGGFTDVASWATYDPGAHGLGSDPDGYPGVLYIEPYVYFVPFNNGTDYHGEVMRYDTRDDLTSTSSWVTFDAVAQGIGGEPAGFMNAVFDDHYLYFVPLHNSTGYHDEVLRYDTTAEFSELASWNAYDPARDGVGGDNHGYADGVFDGRFVYMCPLGYEPVHGEFLRFDPFTCPGDLDRDGDVDLGDLARLLGYYGLTSGATCADGDLDADGSVDLSDLASLLAVYGASCE
jgi:hypothetical protein